MLKMTHLAAVVAVLLIAVAGAALPQAAQAQTPPRRRPRAAAGARGPGCDAAPAAKAPRA